MRRIVLAVLGVFVVVLLVGIGLMTLPVLRQYSDRARCQDHLRELAGFAIWHGVPPGGNVVPEDASTSVPAATVMNLDLPADARMSFYVPMTLPLELKKLATVGLHAEFQPDLSWDAPEHARVIRTRLPVLLCPAAPPPPRPDEPALTQYVGLAGLGEDAANLPVDSPMAGPFRYNGETPLAAFADGRSQTLLIGETNSDIGPWARGGLSTCRGVDPVSEEYIGPGRAFGGMHPEGAWFAYADGSARLIAGSVAPEVFRAQVTIAGVEADAPAP